MSAREVLSGLKATEWRRVYGGAMTTRKCPVCYGYAPGDAIEDECGHDEGCALAAAIQWFEEHVGAEETRPVAEHCDHRLCKQWGDASGNCNCPCTLCREADSEGRHRTLAEYAMIGPRELRARK